MSDFDIVNCGCCDLKAIRTCFSYCSSCDRNFCHSSDTNNCGILCPECDWNICIDCLNYHVQDCWEQEAEVVPNSTGKEYNFYKAKLLKNSSIKLYSNEYGIVKAIVETS